MYQDVEGEHFMEDVLVSVHFLVQPCMVPVSKLPLHCLYIGFAHLIQCT